MGTNEGWPEAFGFSISGGAPVVISEVEDGGSAQQAGLQPGDAIIELDGVCVEQWSKLEVVYRARYASKVPPSLLVMSRVRQFSIPRDSNGGFGLTFRGNCPVFVRSVDYPSPGRTAGVRSGDLLLEINWENVRFCSKAEVLDRIKRTGDVLHLMVVAGGLGSTPRSTIYSEMSAGEERGQGRGADRKTIEMRSQKARIFHTKVNYYLMDDDLKKSHLLTLLRLYSKDRDVDSLGNSLDLLLDTPIQRRLLPHIRSFIQQAHLKRFDILVSYTPDHAPSGRRGSYDLGSPTRSLSPMAKDAQWRSSLPNLSLGGERVVCVDRGSGGFGFTLSGNCPVFIRSVDPGGAASKAGLRPGDRILKLNSLDVRNSTHSHVVRLLRGSGTRPTLVVSSVQATRTLGLSGKSAGSLSQSTGIKKSSKAFKSKMEQVLGADERSAVIEQLGRFSRDQNMEGLVAGLGEVLNDKNKIVLFHYICQLLPNEAQNEFDRIAAAMLSGDSTQSTRGPSAPLSGDGSGRSHDSTGVSHSFGKGGASRLGPLQDTPIGRGTSNPVAGGAATSSLATAASSGPSLADALKARIKTSEGAMKPGASGVPDTSTLSTPGGVPFPPNPPPTPNTGVGGVPVPPPPPPTLPGGGAVNATRLKRVNWEKVPGTEGTIWRELSGLEDALEYMELEEKFASQKPKDAAAGQGAKKKPSVLDPRKAYNISILLGHLKLSFDKIKEAILQCDSTVLSEQHLRQLEAFAPDKNECLGFARYYDNPDSLSIPDRFSCEMSTIPCYRERLKAMVFKLHFKDKVDEIRPDFEAICLASIQLQSSKHLKKVLEIVLAVGNYMNAGNHRVGGATGFRVRYLAQLKDLRTTDNKSTLLHFVAGMAERKFPASIEFPDDLSFIRKAARVSGETLEVEMNELTQGLKAIRRDIVELRSREQLANDQFISIMESFLVEADRQMDDLLKLYSKMKQEYQGAVKFFGEDSTKLRIDDFFGAFATFVDDFERALQENKQERERQALSERRLQELPKKRGPSFKLFGKANKEQEVDLRKELEAKSRSKVVDVAALERRGTQTALSPEQHDFRHLLRQTDHSTSVDQTGPRSDFGAHQTDFVGQLSREEGINTNGSQDYDNETQF